MDRAERYRTTRDPRIAAMKERMKEAGWTPGEYWPAERRSSFAQKIFGEFQYAHPAIYQSYPKEREMFERVVKALAEKSDEYKGKEHEIRALFYHAYINGRMLPVGRLVEKTLGTGTFRMVAEAPFSDELAQRLR